MLTQEDEQLRTHLRKQTRARRKALTAEERKQAALSAREQLVLSNVLSQAKNIALYWDDDGELPTQPLIELAWSMQKNVFLPRLDDKNQMDFVAFNDTDELTSGVFGLQVPAANQQAIDPQMLDLIIAPLVAFDSNGHRLGRGGGYYDRFLQQEGLGDDNNQHKKLYFLGLAYSFQQVDNLPSAEWDIPLDAVITEQQFLQF